MLISSDNLFRWWGADHFPFYRTWTGPFLVAHERHQRRRPAAPWPWDLDGAVQDSLDHTWEMTGKWLARRAVQIDQRHFNQEVPRIVSTLSAVLNESGVASLRRLCELFDQDRAMSRDVIAAIHDAIKETAAIKPTTTLKPMFGSKVLHHFFPSVIPVFDSAWVLNGVMKTEDYRRFMAEEIGEWRSWAYERDGKEARTERELDHYHDYLDYSVARLSEVEPSDLEDLRTQYGDALSSSVSPFMRSDRDSLLWHLDAKVTEWCLCGAAHEEGVLR